MGIMRKMSFWLFFFILCSCLVYFLISSFVSLNEQDLKFEISLRNRIDSRSLNDSEFDKYCDEFGEWSAIRNILFVKRTAVFYITNLKLLRIHAISRPQTRLQPQLIFKVDNNSINITIESSEITSKWSVEEYNFITIDFKFDLSKYCGIENMKKLDLRVKIQDLQLNQNISKDLKVKIKSTESLAKKSAMICGKCLHLKKSSDLMLLKWWIDLNKQIGYEKIFLCNHSIENDATFHKLFSQYQNFLTLDHLECLPDLRTFKKKYHKSYLNLVGKDKQYNVYKFEVINQLIENECYLENIDKYKYIVIEDIDETVIPVTSEKQKCNKYKDFGEKKNIINYITGLLESQNVTEPKTIYFQNALYLENNLIDSLFKPLESIASNFKSSKLTNYSLELNVTDEARIDEKNRTRRHVLIFSIKSQTEFNYAINLFESYKTNIKPFLMKHKHELSKTSQVFDRFFYLIDKVNYFGAGKSIHNTAVTFDASIHHSVTFISNQSLKIDKDFTSPGKARYLAMPYNIAHLSHFRKQMNFLGRSEIQKFSIFSLHLDLNYFNCYFQHIFAKFSP
jgi:hypothetical protein